MRYPSIKVPARKRVLIHRFLGYEHLPAVSPGAFYDMKNLSGEAAPLLRTRARRVEAETLEGCPLDGVNAMGGRGTAAVLDCGGSLWCGGRALPRLLDGVSELHAYDSQNQPVDIPDPEALLPAIPTPGFYRYRYSSAAGQWMPLDGSLPLAGELLAPAELTDGQELTLSQIYTLNREGRRNLVFLGGWVCVFPDGKYANTVKLRSGEPMILGEDYGDIAQTNECSQGGTLFTPCGEDGSPWDAVWSDSPPAQGLWVDTTEPEKTLRLWSQAQNLWLELSPYVKCQIPGIAKGLRAGDCVSLRCRLESNQGGEKAVEAFWEGTHILAGAYHDPGGSGRPEGQGDYLILPGLLSQSFEIELTWHDRSYLQVSRPFPEMDYVVEAGNRLWGCRFGNGVNELYGCKLGDFRNWNAFSGLSTDSYRVSRGHDGPYTGAAVLGGCPLFFRADCLEKIYPSAGGDHGVVTVSLEGIQPGSADSAVVIRDRLYYKSPGGVCCYNGTLPVRISKALGEIDYHSAAGGARGSRYYLSMLDSQDRANLFVYDSETGIWHREDDCRFCSAYETEGLLYLLSRPGGPVLCVGQAEDSRKVDWWAETGDLLPRMGSCRYLSRLRITARLDLGAELRVYLRYDGGPWLRRGELRGNQLKSLTLSLPTHRCGNLQLRLEGSGGMELHALSWLTEAGSDG